MKISILCPNLSSNALGRAYILAQILREKYQVEIIGPATDAGLWEAVGYDKSIEIKAGRTRELPGKIQGDVIFASKPLIGSYGIGLLHKIKTKKKLFLDIDDWQLGFVKNEYRTLSFGGKIKKLLRDTKRFYWLDSIWNNWVCEKLVFMADHIIVSNTFLQKKFGGDIIWHGRDMNLFDPAKIDRDKTRQSYGIQPQDKIVIFSGTPRVHKGLEDLIEALASINHPHLKLMLLGLIDEPYSNKIEQMAQEKLKNRFIGFGLKPIYMVPEFLSAADIVAIPQRKNFASFGQIPAKIFDAMAMEKPIIATALNDMPAILDGCGWTVPAGQPGEMAAALRKVLEQPGIAREYGQKAREKYIREYSLQAMTKKLLDIFEKKLSS